MPLILSEGAPESMFTQLWLPLLLQTLQAPGTVVESVATITTIFIPIMSLNRGRYFHMTPHSQVIQHVLSM